MEFVKKLNAKHQMAIAVKTTANSLKKKISSQ